MDVELRAPHHVPSLTKRLNARMERTFSHLMHLVQEVRATLRGIRGPEGTEDQRASVAVRLVDGTVIFAEAQADHPGTAMAMATARARRAVLTCAQPRTNLAQPVPGG